MDDFNNNKKSNKINGHLFTGINCPRCGNELDFDGWGGGVGKFNTDLWYHCKKCDGMFKNL